MQASDAPIVIATRGSALALAQTHGIAAACRAAFPSLRFEIKIIKTTGDKLQAVPANAPGPAAKGLFTKELEMALLQGDADLAVHSLKDLPTDLPDGLKLAAVTQREDVRDVLIYRDARFCRQALNGNPTKPVGSRKEMRGLKPGAALQDFPREAILATSSTRRQAQLLALRPDLNVIPIRGNVGTRLRKMSEMAELDGIVLAAAGLNRLRIRISPDGKLFAEESVASAIAVPQGLLGRFLSLEEMLPCVGQGAIGIEARERDERTDAVCLKLDDAETHACVEAERSFLRAMGGGCLSPVAAHAELRSGELQIRGVSFQDGTARKAEARGSPADASELGVRLAGQLRG